MKTKMGILSNFLLMSSKFIDEKFHIYLQAKIKTIYVEE